MTQDVDDAEERTEGVAGVLDAIEEAVGQARAMPMSSSVLVNRAELLELVDQVRAALPDQLYRADEVLADADRAHGSRARTASGDRGGMGARSGPLVPGGCRTRACGTVLRHG